VKEKGSVVSVSTLDTIEREASATPLLRRAAVVRPLALVTLYDIVALSDSFGEMDFSVPYFSLGVLLVGTVAASLLATVWPTVSASRIRPAVALRMTD